MSQLGPKGPLLYVIGFPPSPSKRANRLAAQGTSRTITWRPLTMLSRPSTRKMRASSGLSTRAYRQHWCSVAFEGQWLTPALGTISARATVMSSLLLSLTWRPLGSTTRSAPSAGGSVKEHLVSGVGFYIQGCFACEHNLLIVPVASQYTGPLCLNV